MEMSRNDVRPADPKAKVSRDELIQLKSECQNLWDRKMKSFGYRVSFFVKVAALMISWDSRFEDLKTEEEV